MTKLNFAYLRKMNHHTGVQTFSHEILCLFLLSTIVGDGNALK